MTPSFIVATFYKFVKLSDYRELCGSFHNLCSTNSLLGTILLAEEGINGTIAGSAENMNTVLKSIRTDPRLSDLTHKTAYHREIPFKRLKIKARREIVTMGVRGIDPVRHAGTYVPPGDWNALISDPDVMLIDARNDYEVQIGTFKGAVNPQTRHFTEFPDYVKAHLDPDRHPKVAMFCTGGIRCEKATAFLRQEGFEEIYHLQGGILKYLETVPTSDTLWEGECFVFDERVSVDDRLQRGHFALCKGCGNPVARATKTDSDKSYCQTCAPKHAGKGSHDESNSK